jgi:hypothetical protein
MRLGENVELRFPLIIIRTKRASAVFEVLGRSRFAGAFGLASAIALPVLAGVATYFLLTSLTLMLTRPEVQQVQRELGPASYVLLPGLNPYLPLLYGWLGIVVALIVHEGAHGVVARRYNYTVRSSGIVLFLGIPIGAFVETDENEIKTGRFSEVVKILSSGPASNAAVAVLALVGVLVVTSGIVPSIPLVVDRVVEGYPAAAAGIEPGDRIVSVNGSPVHSLQDLRSSFSAAGIGGTVTVGVERGGKVLEFHVKLADIGNGTPGLGVMLRDADLLAFASNTLQQLQIDRLLETGGPSAAPDPGLHPVSLLGPGDLRREGAGRGLQERQLALHAPLARRLLQDCLFSSLLDLVRQLQRGHLQRAAHLPVGRRTGLEEAVDGLRQGSGGTEDSIGDHDGCHALLRLRHHLDHPPALPEPEMS